jgi:predicted phosphodiesterase
VNQFMKSLVGSKSIRGFALAAFFLAAFASPAPDPELLRGPYLQNQTETAVTVLWATAGTESSGVVEVDGIGPFAAQSEGDLGSITRHRARVTGLEGDTDYRYRIRTDNLRQSDWTPFHTNKPQGKPLRFILIGDSGDGADQSHQKNVASQMVRANPDFWLHLGDLVQSNYREDDFDYNTARHFAIYQQLNRSRPHCPTRGNHESTGVQFRKDFDFPPSTAAVPEVYDFTYGDFWIASLSTGHRGDFRDPKDDSSGLYRDQWQYVWLRERLRTVAKPFLWKLVMFHRPTYNSAMRYEEFMVKGTKDITELCEDEGVDFIAFGHVHALQRSKPVRRGRVVGRSLGVVHLGSSGGGAMNLAGPGKRDYFHTDFVEGAKWGFLQVDVSYKRGASKCTLTFIDENGSVLDRWSKKKKAPRKR